jgi:hypothetical protein
MTTFNDAFLERLRDDAVVQEEKMWEDLFINIFIIQKYIAK